MLHLLLWWHHHTITLFCVTVPAISIHVLPSWLQTCMCCQNGQAQRLMCVAIWLQMYVCCHLAANVCVLPFGCKCMCVAIWLQMSLGFVLHEPGFKCSSFTMSSPIGTKHLLQKICQISKNNAKLICHVVKNTCWSID